MFYDTHGAVFRKNHKKQWFREEVFIIKMTNQVAKGLGADKRSNYGRDYYPVESVISTKKR